VLDDRDGDRIDRFCQDDPHWRRASGFCATRRIASAIDANDAVRRLTGSLPPAIYMDMIMYKRDEQWRPPLD
jgi:hypothetical protein